MSESWFSKSPKEWLSTDAWESLDDLRNQFKRHVDMRMKRGDVRAAILRLLLESPMHGYQIIHEIESRSGGVWKPSAGSVYPALQLLVDEGLISAHENEGRRTYTLTDSGRETAEADSAATAPWETGTDRPDRCSPWFERADCRGHQGHRRSDGETARHVAAQLEGGPPQLWNRQQTADCSSVACALSANPALCRTSSCLAVVVRAGSAASGAPQHCQSHSYASAHADRSTIPCACP